MGAFSRWLRNPFTCCLELRLNFAWSCGYVEFGLSKSIGYTKRNAVYDPSPRHPSWMVGVLADSRAKCSNENLFVVCVERPKEMNLLALHGLGETQRKIVPNSMYPNVPLVATRHRRTGTQASWRRPSRQSTEKPRRADFTISLDSTNPNDPRFPDLFGMNNVGQSGGVHDADIDAPEAWDLTIGSHNNVVGVIDTGIDYNHPDLAGNVWTNPGEIAGDGIDNDANGYIDDLHGYDFVNGDGDPLDDNGHGTHVPGTIGATGNNGVGVTGVNWQVQIMALKFLGSSGSGAISAAVSALNHATMMRNSLGVNIRLTSNSWGGGAFSQAMSDAIAASGNAGMLFVAAAGNNASNNDTTVSYPAGYDLPNVISVAATDQNDVLASFSNYGATTVDLAAPGVNILSTTRNNTYRSLSGTSMATPHVSGVAALAWSLNPSATYQQVRGALLTGVDLVPSLSGRTAYRAVAQEFTAWI